ncbi:glycosyltransferase family 4 protein [Oceanobacillus senegalensis]|uniref:glycosyltransferase family 4 protein n=1 Tax=Oceanobacillus senegalensis TaxID=1936063 RepID=UPI000A311108|nr:glycosyltransferase family 4 protein [Oceanobacillus senegalensis]
MKVAMISWEYPPQFSGGLGIHCQALTKELADIGVEIEYYLPKFKEFEFSTPDGMAIHHVQMSHSFSDNSYLGSVMWDSVMEFRNQLNKQFDPTEVDMIHAHDWMGVYAATEIAQKHHIPFIWTVHSTEYDRSGGMSMNPAVYTIEQEALSTVTHTIAVSNRTKDILVNRYGANPDQVTSIYNGIDISSYRPLANRNYQETDGYVLFLGRLTGQKAPEDFLEAAKLVISEREHTRFMIAGDGDLLHKLRLKARRWKIADKVEFPGTVFGDKLLDCYKNATLFVLPSRSEPFGITVLEAMASGVPTIISSTTGALEMVHNVLVVEPNQPEELAKAILKLLGDTNLRQDLGKKGAQEALNWSWKHVAAKTQLLYKELLK